MKLLQAVLKKPVYIFFILCALLGLSIFRDYGFTWDEPLFYKYADALGYAYNPANWFSGHFDLNLSYGPSATDHKTRGPAYLLLAREPVYLIEKLNIQTDDAWHLVNYLAFLLGVYFLFQLCSRLMGSPAALAASALFLFQPLLFGHAFINPKDPPFLVFLTGSVYLGIGMVDRLADPNARPWRSSLVTVLLAAFFLGIATSIRVLGPLAGVIVFIYFLIHKPNRTNLFWMVLYAVLAALVMFASWPYLWENPIHFFQVSQFMSDNPTGLQVLFGGQIYRAYDLPLRYLPFYLFFTLTEPVWPFFLLGLVCAFLKLRTDRATLSQALLFLAWFAIPFTYDILRHPPIYDGMRHFLFILPPIFIFAGFTFEFLFEALQKVWRNALLILVALSPRFFGIIQLHPYSYTYYIAFIGGTAGVSRRYETDFWLTSYKQAVLQLCQP